MSEQEAETVFATIRWASDRRQAGLPALRRLGAYQDRRPSGSLRFRCKACKGSFSLTSGTLFAFHSFRFGPISRPSRSSATRSRASAALALSRDLGVQYKTAFVLAHKLREAVASEMKGVHVGGEGKVAEVDGGYFGGYVKPANHLRAPRRSPLGQQSEWQAQGRGRDPRTRWPHASRRLQARRRLYRLHQVSGCKGTDVTGR